MSGYGDVYNLFYQVIVWFCVYGEIIMLSNFFNLVIIQIWVNGWYFVCCVKVIQEIWDVCIFCFMVDQLILFFFKLGQFVILELEIDGELVMCFYIIFSLFLVFYSFFIIIKWVLGGWVFNWLYDNFKEGQELLVYGLVGLFNVIDFLVDKVLFFFGGVGIILVMFMVCWFFDINVNVDMVFVYSVCLLKDIIYYCELEYMVLWIDNFSLYIICECYGFGEVWVGYCGYLNLCMLEFIVLDFFEWEIFCCGLMFYMSVVKYLLQGYGYDMSCYYEEVFGLILLEVCVDVRELVVEVVEVLEVLVVDQYQVEFIVIGKSICVSFGEIVYVVVVKFGLYILKVCGMGICGICKVMKIVGEVEMEYNGGIIDEDVVEGYIFFCCSVFKGDVVIDY